MSNYLAQYCVLISSAAQIESCRQARTLSELLAQIKQLWDCLQLTDDALLSEITHLNQTPITVPDIELAGNWLPYRYQAKNRVVNWLLPHGHAVEPFQDETISRYRHQLLLNQIIQPCTSLGIALQQAKSLVHAEPAGFIFHLSRCGSTLISGCLSESETTCVFSESPLLTELLLDGSLSSGEQQIGLRTLITLQAAAFSHRPQMIIKWNAWDIFRWEFIRELYPQVPVIFLVRNPVEILASHQRLAGRHMSGDPSMADYHPVFSNWGDTHMLLEKKMAVLGDLLNATYEGYSEKTGFLIDYNHLNFQTVVNVFQIFEIKLDELGFLKVQDRMRFHSKAPGHVFLPDVEKKLSVFTRQEQEIIQRSLAPVYNRLLTITSNSIKAVINVQ